MTVSSRSYYLLFKRVFDLVVVTPFIVLLSPVLLWTVLRLHFSSSSFISVVLLGRASRPYHSYTADSDLLRRALRLWDVFVGRASLVGPRIAPLGELDNEAIALRTLTPPGIVCLHWLRVRSNVAFGPESISDREYVEQRSLSADVSVLVRALLVCLYGAPACAMDRSVEILGVNIDNCSMDEALESIESAIDNTRSPQQIAFVNADCLNHATKDADYRAALEDTALVLPDGIGLKIAGSLLSRPIRQNVNGTDLFPRLCERLNARSARLFLLGAKERVVQALAERIRVQYPRIVLCGVENGYFKDEAAMVRKIAATEADVLLVALGAPRQDTFISRNRSHLGAKVCIGVGGLFDFYSGRIPRAPQWLREAGLEWTYRLYQEPGRMWKRYLVGNLVFLFRVAAERCGVSYNNHPTAVIR